jgi:hypothetical protein
VATYAQVQNLVKRIYGFKPKPCWIAHIKELNGIAVRRAWNRRGEARLVPCPPEKRRVIEKVLHDLGVFEN